MCKFKRYVNNRYIGRSVLVSCGHCEECLQEKANARAARIRNHSADPSTGLCLFVTLTYSNHFVPYVKFEDIEKAKELARSKELVRVSLPVYRDTKVRCYKGAYRTLHVQHVVSHIDCNDILDFDYIPSLTHKPNCFGVCLYDDVQRFMKRLRINLQRFANYNEKITYYCVSEYGGKKFRCHFHLLIYFPKGSYETIRPYVVKSWAYGDLSKSRKRIQIPRNVASYVAAYVNKSANLPKICKSDSFKSSFSHSKFFGIGLHCFSLPSLLEKADRGNMCYTKQTLKNGLPVLVDVPMPKYVVNRFFPRFKGDSLLSLAEIQDVLLSPIRLWDKLGEHCKSKFHYLTSYTFEEFRLFSSNLRKCIDFYIEQTKKTIYDYVIDYFKVWRSRASYVLRHQYDNIVDFCDFYFNANEFIDNPSIAPTLSLDKSYYYNYNNFPRDLCKSKKLIDLYHEKENQRISTALMLSEIYDDM